MKSKIICLIALVAIFSGCSNQATRPTPSNQPICIIPGTPDAKFEIIRHYRVGKGSYGSVEDILPKFAVVARKLGADAVINYSGSQRFGFWPWRFVRPVAQGVAVKWKDETPLNCNKLGGRQY